MKIWKMNDTDFVAADTAAEAIEELTFFYGDDRADGDPVELTDDELDELQFNGDVEDPYEEPLTYRQELAKRIEDEEEFPQFFASSAP